MKQRWKISRKSCTLFLAVVCLAAVAGIAAHQAFATDYYYCSNCYVGSTPAVSPFSETTWYYNYMDAEGNLSDLQVYLYNDSNGVECSNAADGVYYVDSSCGATANDTARCHVLHGAGPLYAHCYASFT